jgi:hypothetical protein
MRKPHGQKITDRGYPLSHFESQILVRRPCWRGLPFTYDVTLRVCWGFPNRYPRFLSKRPASESPTIRTELA